MNPITAFLAIADAALELLSWNQLLCPIENAPS
jgi:hypothetical protein